MKARLVHLILLVSLPILPLTAEAPADPRRSPVVLVVERISPAVVNISAEAMVRQADPFFGDFFPFRRARPVQSLGSGLIIDKSGLVVTNAHVIEGASRIVVTMKDGRELDAEVLGSDQDATWHCSRSRARASCRRCPSGKARTCSWGRRCSPLAIPSAWPTR